MNLLVFVFFQSCMLSNFIKGKEKHIKLRDEASIFDQIYV